MDFILKYSFTSSNNLNAGYKFGPEIVIGGDEIFLNLKVKIHRIYLYLKKKKSNRMGNCKTESLFP